MTWIYGGQANDTCDIYHSGNNPPNAPDVSGVKIYVIPRFRNIKGDFNGLFSYTHILLMPLDTDVRDGFAGTNPAGPTDTLYLPNSSSPGMEMSVIFVCRRRMRGWAPDYLEVYCTTDSWVYPTQEG
jgi:hypothetical protein